MQQFIYSVNIQNNYCNFILKVNDIDLYSETENGGMNTTFRFNEFLSPVANVLMVRLLPMKDQPKLHPQALFKVKILAESVTIPKTQVTIFEQNSPDLQENEKKGIPIPEKYDWAIPLKVTGVPKDMFLEQLEIIKPNDRLINDLFARYKDLRDFFAKKNVDALLRAVTYRNTDKSKAYFEPLAEINERSRAYFLNTLNQNDNKLVGVDPSIFKLKMEGANKLVSLVSPFGNPPIIYYNQAADWSSYFPFRFGRLKGRGDELIVIR